MNKKPRKASVLLLAVVTLSACGQMNRARKNCRKRPKCI